MQNPLSTHGRQVHLDFHTSPHIPGVGSEFDADAFVQTFKDAHVNSATVFAKCHHGMCYFPTTTGTQHPHLNGRDLLGEQIEALHRAGMRAPIYTTVAWEEDVAQHHPEWKMMRKDGRFARVGNADFNAPAHAGGWWFNNFLHPEYGDYIEAHVRELLANYDVDGLFFDICFFEGQSCWSEESIKFREARGLMGDDARTQAHFEAAGQEFFAQRFTRLVQGLNPAATIFYNSTNPIYADTSAGVRTRHELQSHWELESLPSGFWGYHHFPRLARAFGNWGKPWLGMTGRFQTMWGDFGGLKPRAALEYECFRTQALGGANSVGDQLPPRGTLDAGAYDLIGAVYEQVERAEPFYQGSISMAQIGIVAPGAPELPGAQTDLSLEGAVQMCDEAHYDSAVLDEQSDFSPYELLILPDSVTLTSPLRDKLRAFVQSGGKLLVSHRSGFDASGKSELDLPLQIAGEVEKYPTFWRAKSEFSPAMSRSDRVFYARGLNVEIIGENATILIERVLPYFNRTDLTFSSHAQTPPVVIADAFAAAIAGENFVYFADPIFSEYRQAGNIAARDAWKLAMERLIGAAPIGAGLPTTILCCPRRRNADLILTLLHYIPTRKSLKSDMIEERSALGGEELRLARNVEMVRDFESGAELLPNETGAFVLPMKKGRLLLEVPNFFAA